MRKTTMRRWLSTSVATLMGAGALTGLTSLAPTGAQATAPAPDQPLSCADSEIVKDLANGASWRMCARIHPIKGLILEQIEYKPPTAREYSGYKRVLDQLGIAQLNVPYDTGHVQYNDITSYGFGKQYLMEQGKEQCKGDLHDVPQSFMYRNELIERTIPAICTDEIDTGLQTHAQETQIGGGVLYVDQGTALEVASISKISWYEYQQRITFDDHGNIEVGLGATGDIAPGAPGSNFFSTNPKVGWPLGGAKTADGQETYASSHWHNAIWKVDFGIDKGERQTVEQWDFASPGAGTRAPIIEGTGTVKNKAFTSIPGADHDELSWWRVKNPASLNPDGHARSYEIVNQNYANETIPVTQPLVTFTNYRTCEEYASDNLNAGCPGKSILDYVAEDTHDLTDPVAWVNVGFHHTDKDEDQSPMPIHWQKFQLVPRDFFAQKPTMTDARSCVNGPTGGSVNSTTRPCIATNTVPPSISASTEVPAAGTTLTATPGEWNTSRTTWNYQYMWFRDGEAIVNTDAQGEAVPAVGETYVLTEQDLGSAVTVKVTASQTGYPSGTAESAPLVVPGGPDAEEPPTEEPPTEEPASPVVSKVAIARAKASWTPRQRPVIVVAVRAAGATPTGTVQAMRSGRVLAKGTLLPNGKVRLVLRKFAKPGRYLVNVRYLGSSTVKASSGKVWIRIKR